MTYADVFASQPFRNQLVTLTLTGNADQGHAGAAMARSEAAADPAGLEGFPYAWDGAKPYGERVIADRMSLNGQPIDPAASYRVTVNDYLAVGGDGFTVLKKGPAPQFGVYDVDALYAYFQANSPIDPTDRAIASRG